MVWGTQYQLSQTSPVRIGFAIAGCLQLPLIVLLVRRRKKSSGRLAISLTAFHSVFLLADFFSFRFSSLAERESLSPGGPSFYTSFDKPCAHIDSLIGYRWVPGDHRITMLAGHQVIYNNTFHANASGFVSGIDFIPHKKDSLALRYMILGDSYSSGIFHAKNWPTLVSASWTTDGSGPAPELYNFSMDGGGVVNWYGILMNEILPNYEFDGLIMAVAENDLLRNFFVLHHDGNTEYSSYLEGNAPHGIGEMLNSPGLSQTSVQPLPRTDSMLLAAKSSRGPSWPFRFLYLPARLEAATAASESAEAFADYAHNLSMPAKDLTREEVISAMGERQFRLMSLMLDTLQQLNKHVVLLSVPDLTELMAAEAGVSTQKLHCLDWFSQEYNTSFCKGSEAFSATPRNQQRETFYFPYDYHWNDRGVQEFSTWFARWLPADIAARKAR